MELEWVQRKVRPMIRAARIGPFWLLLAEVVRHMIHDKSIEADVPLPTSRDLYVLHVLYTYVILMSCVI